jgi:hypothetical protein
MPRTMMRTALLATALATVLVLAASRIPVHAPPLISPYVRLEEIDISLEEMRRIALGSYLMDLISPMRQEEYILTIGQYVLDGGGPVITDRQMPVYIIRLFGDTGYVSPTGVVADYLEIMVHIKERRVYGGGLGSSAMSVPIDVNVVDFATELPPARKTLHAQGMRIATPLPETTAEARP